MDSAFGNILKLGLEEESNSSSNLSFGQSLSSNFGTNQSGFGHAMSSAARSTPHHETSMNPHSSNAQHSLLVDLNLTGTDNSDLLTGRGGNDTLNGMLGVDLLQGNGGDDTLIFNPDYIFGRGWGAQNVGSPDAYGTGEIVWIQNKYGSFDIFDGGDGFDTLEMTNSSDALFLQNTYVDAYQNSGDFRIIDIEQINAGGGDDVVDFTEYDFNYGDIIINGGSGDDTLWSSIGNDVINGESGDDNIWGGVGSDILNGGSGDDVIYGGAGMDSLEGGSGADTFAFRENSAFDGIDTIKDFNIHEGDTLDISDILSEYDPLTDAIEDFVEFTEHDAHSNGGGIGHGLGHECDNGGITLSVDADGGGDNFVAIAIINGSKDLDLQTLVDDGNLVVV